MRRKVGLIGHPLGHTLSPAFQQAAFDHLGIAAVYRAYDLPPEDVPAFVAGLRAPDWLGVNVTVPHKERVRALLDGEGPEATAVGAVNTIVNDGGRLVGHNTDVVGFRDALVEVGFAVRGARCVVLGAGGAARAVVYALRAGGAAEIVVANRHVERAQRLLADLAPNLPSVALPLDAAALATALAHCDLLVNSTSVGLRPGESPLPDDSLPDRALVYDLVYNPPQTRFLAAAAARGARTLGGLSMLVGQGAASFTLWTGRPAPREVMRLAAEAALARLAQR
ncbi:MAG: shikimate dehydrogenase [Chloroflexi bacterium]|nr:shikimate dehydrogenase [Chloroflexota bacterium]